MMNKLCNELSLQEEPVFCQQNAIHWTEQEDHDNDLTAYHLSHQNELFIPFLAIEISDMYSGGWYKGKAMVCQATG